MAPRGVAPHLLIQQIKNTAPFALDSTLSTPYGQVIQRAALLTPNSPELSHFEYFRLCLSAHYATVATFVPTDVDNQIRFKLWHPGLANAVLIEMAELVIQAHEWDTRPVSARWVRTASGRELGGHMGEWFSVAAAAYGSLRKRAPEVAADVAALIVSEAQHEAEVYQEFRASKDGIGALKAATLIAHNLGDLDRVIDLWHLPPEDPLRRVAYKAGHGEGAITCAPLLTEAGRLNKDYMAAENHRHFPLRAPKCLRKSADLLLPLAPFLDTWGARLPRHPDLSPEEIGTVVEALVDGWDRLRAAAQDGTGPVGYARALSGILEAFPGGANALSHYVPARVDRALRGGLLRSQISVSRARFEEQWNQWGARPLSAR